MAKLVERRYGISEVAALLEVEPHLLRQWEARFPQLKPKRDRANRRYYSTSDIEVARRIKQLLRHDRMTSAGARKRITQEQIGQGQPRTRQEAIDLIDALERDVRALLDLLGPE